MDGEKTQRINQWLHPYAPFLEPSHRGEEGKLINISLGYEVIPLCMGPGKLCINVGRQTWAFVLPPKEDFWTLLPLLSVNHVYYWNFRERVRERTKTLCKRWLTLCWNITMTEDFLAGLTVKWHLLLLQLSSINKLGLNNGTLETCCQHWRTWDLDWTFRRDQSWS